MLTPAQIQFHLSSDRPISPNDVPASLPAYVRSLNLRTILKSEDVVSYRIERPYWLGDG